MKLHISEDREISYLCMWRRQRNFTSLYVEKTEKLHISVFGEVRENTQHPTSDPPSSDLQLSLR